MECDTSITRSSLILPTKYKCYFSSGVSMKSILKSEKDKSDSASRVMSLKLDRDVNNKECNIVLLTIKTGLIV